MTRGYKAFNSDMTNRYGMKFEENKVYIANGEIKFGNNGNGFHFAKRLEDTLRYVPGMEEDVKIALVTSFGEEKQVSDEYYGYYDLCVAKAIRIDKILSREEILQIVLNSSIYSAIRFISGFRLSKDEVEMFKKKYNNDPHILNAISYYQAQERNFEDKPKVKKMAKKDDRNECK